MKELKNSNSSTPRASSGVRTGDEKKCLLELPKGKGQLVGKKTGPLMGKVEAICPEEGYGF